MTRRYTGAEALALKAAATAGPLFASDDCEPVRICHTQISAYNNIVAGHDAAGRGQTLTIGDAALFAAAPNLADSLAAVEAERDEAIAQLRADDSPSRRPCGDNSCVLREPGPHGMGTNGGCRCPAGLLRSRYRVLRAERDALRAKIACVAAAHDTAQRVMVEWQEGEATSRDVTAATSAYEASLAALREAVPG